MNVRRSGRWRTSIHPVAIVGLVSAAALAWASHPLLALGVGIVSVIGAILIGIEERIDEIRQMIEDRWPDR